MKFYFCRKNNGVTLIELLIAVAISGILAAGFYRGFINQQRVYTVQGQVADMQQNARIALGKMIREIRMAGFGGLDYVLGLSGGVNGFTQRIVPGSNTITIVGGFKPVRRDNGDPIQIVSISGSQVTLNYATDDFDTSTHRYISIGGIESNTVQSRSGAILTLAQPPTQTHPAGTLIFEIQAITYNLDETVIRRNGNTGGGGQSVAENMENLQFQYFDKNGNSTANPADVRLVKVSVTAKTDMVDPEFKGGDGYRRRMLSSSVRLRNF